VPNFVHQSNRYPDIAIFRLSSGQPSVILDFQKLVIFIADRVPWRGSKCIIVPNFAAIGQTLADHFWIFQDGSRRYLGFLKHQIFNGQTR